MDVKAEDLQRALRWDPRMYNTRSVSVFPYHFSPLCTGIGNKGVSSYLFCLLATNTREGMTGQRNCVRDSQSVIFKASCLIKFQKRPTSADVDWGEFQLLHLSLTCKLFPLRTHCSSFSGMSMLFCWLWQSGKGYVGRIVGLSSCCIDRRIPTSLISHY